VKVLLDECVSRRLVRELSGHDVKTCKQMGWLSIKNGRLLKLAATEFDVFVTVDANMSFQQDRGALPLPVVVLRIKGPRPADVLLLAPALRKALESVPSEPITVIGPL
jgi:predicted nuclease of predicted toxin-antitoxin system